MGHTKTASKNASESIGLVILVAFGEHQLRERTRSVSRGNPYISLSYVLRASTC